MAFGIIKERRRIAQFSILLDTDSAGLELWEVRGGKDGERPVGRWWVPTGKLYELAGVLAEQDMDFYDAARITPGGVVLDVGAHVGGFVRVALAHGAGTILASDPTPITRECLLRNCTQEIRDGRVVVMQAGLWSEATTLAAVKFMRCDATRPFTEETRDARPVPVTTIDALSLDRVDFIKMDIEGAERHALAGALLTLAAFKPHLAIAAYHLKDDHAAISAVIRVGNPAYVIQSTFNGFVLIGD